MASEFDVLLDKVDDPALRADLKRQVELLRARRRFGLVFEEHLPERVLLPEHTVRRGTRVVLRDHEHDEPREVVKVAKRKATLRTADGASISAMERAFDSGRRRLFDAHTLYLLSKVFDVPIIYFFLPPPSWIDRTLDGTDDPVGSLLESSLGTTETMTIINRRLVETAGRPPDGNASLETDASERSRVERWRGDLRRMYEIDCNARLREIADLLRALTDQHDPVGAGT